MLHVHPTKTLISLHGSVLARRHFASSAIQYVASEDSDQTAQIGELGSAVQSVVSLTSSLVVKMLTVLESNFFQQKY